jgi:hypothetical protein
MARSSACRGAFLVIPVESLVVVRAVKKKVVGEDGVAMTMGSEKPLLSNFT